MKKIGLLIFAFALIIGVVASFSTSLGRFSFFTPKVVGSGILKTEVRDVSDFTIVETSGAMNVEIIAAKEFSVEVDADDNLLEYVKTELDGSTLKIYTEKWFTSKSKMNVRISMPELSSAKVSGASNLTITDIKNDDFTLKASGASKIKVAGETKSFDFKLSGASELNAENLTSEIADAKVSGASNAVLNVTESLDADASGASRISYIGEVKSLKKHSSDSSSIKQRN